MFLYWKGYEIDGSDTDYDIVLPESRELAVFVQCFLSIPLFGDSEPRVYCYSNQHNEMVLSHDELFQQLKRGDRPEIYIDINCKIMDELPAEIQAKLYSFSACRDPRERAYGRVENPCMEPMRQLFHDRGGMTVSLQIHKNGWHVTEDMDLKGFVRNERLMRSSSKDYPYFSINVGPGFYYEYAMFIMDYLIDSFPGLGSAGGLDCAGGWTMGCTYGNSIYAFERIQLPVKHNIKHTLKRLTEYDIVRSFQQHYDKNWGRVYDYIDDFNMENVPKEKMGKEYLLSFSEYLRNAEQACENSANAVSALLDTAAHILLPMPSRYAKNPLVEARLKEALSGLDENERRYYMGYMAFTNINGENVCEFRIPWKLKKYFMLLLELMESGEIDFIKSETYARRHD